MKALICFKSKFICYFTRGISVFCKNFHNFFVIPFLGMTPEYKREKQPSRGVLQTGVIMQLFCNCNEIPRKISVKGLTFTKVASLQLATLSKIPGNEFFKDIDNNNGTSCFIE